MDVRHFLDIYQTRLESQEEGITNPSPEIKLFVREFVKVLSAMPLDEEIEIKGNSFYDSKGKMIATIPD